MKLLSKYDKAFLIKFSSEDLYNISNTLRSYATCRNSSSALEKLYKLSNEIIKSSDEYFRYINNKNKVNKLKELVLNKDLNSILKSKYEILFNLDNSISKVEEVENDIDIQLEYIL